MFDAARKSFRRWRLKRFPEFRRLELRFVTYAAADELIRNNFAGPYEARWWIAKEEDRNPLLGMVFIERKERITE